MTQEMVEMTSTAVWVRAKPCTLAKRGASFKKEHVRGDRVCWRKRGQSENAGDEACVSYATHFGFFVHVRPSLILEITL